VLAVSDALPLVDQVAGVLIVVRMNRTTRDAIDRLKTVLTSAKANLLGIVATDAAPSQSQNYGYGYGYYGASSTPAAASKRRFGRNRPPASQGNGNGQPDGQPRVARRAERGSPE
jgi:Mrp family chromosome partitioning ATPase